MPIEIRHLVFSDTEVIHAIQNYHRKVEQPLPTGTILSLTLRERPSPSATLLISVDREDKRQELRIENDQLLASLILYCHDKNIPLPARGIKRLTLIDGRLVVLVELRARR